MTALTDGSVRIQISSESVPSTPSWFGAVVLMAAHLRKHDILTKIAERVRFARRRFGRYEVIDFLAVQIALCHQRGTDPGSLLCQAPNLCGSLHGLI